MVEPLRPGVTLWAFVPEQSGRSCLDSAPDPLPGGRRPVRKRLTTLTYNGPDSRDKYNSRIKKISPSKNFRQYLKK